MGRYSRPPDQASVFAQAWAQLPQAKQHELAQVVQRELRKAKAAVDAEAPDPLPGNVTVLNRAASGRTRRPPQTPRERTQTDAAFAKAAADAQRVERRSRR